MKKIIFLFLIISLVISTSCTGVVRITGIYDFFQRYYFEVPFENTPIKAPGDMRFTTDYTMEQMVEHLNVAGYIAEIYSVGDVATILVTAMTRGRAHYFVIFENNDDDCYWLDTFLVRNASSAIRRPTEGFRFFLAPIHVMEDTSSDVGLRRFYSTFGHLAEFYRATGRDDVIVDEESKAIYLENVVLRYTENENGSFLYVSLR